MQVHEHRLHPDWLARLEMFRQFASGVKEPQTEAAEAAVPPEGSSIDERWPLPKLTYRHRSTFSHRPR